MTPLTDQDIDVAIIGGGLAGLAAAETLSSAESGPRRIVVFESRRNLGGRTASFVDQATGEQIDYCQHAAMGCCTNFIDMMRRCGLESDFRRESNLTFLHPDATPSRFAPWPWLPAPLHLLPAIMSQRYLSVGQKAEIVRGLWKLMRTPSTRLINATAETWLIDAGQSQQTRDRFWNVILVSALGEHTRVVSMAAARKVLMDGFAACRGASDVLTARVSLSDLIGVRLARSLQKRGIEIRCGCSVERVSQDGRCRVANEWIKPRATVCAVPWFRVGNLFADWPDDASRDVANLGAISKIPSSPITGIHLWFDRPLSQNRQYVLVESEAQWVFREPTRDEPSGPIAGSPSNEQEHYHQVVISAASKLSGVPKDRLIDQVLNELRSVFPVANQATLLRYKVVTNPHSVFSVRPEVESVRPSSRTAYPWLWLAGDWIRTGWPATMEGAVISGRMAADGILREFFEPNRACDSVLPGLKPSFLSSWLIQ